MTNEFKNFIYALAGAAAGVLAGKYFSEKHLKNSLNDEVRKAANDILADSAYRDTVSGIVKEASARIDDKAIDIAVAKAADNAVENKVDDAVRKRVKEIASEQIKETVTSAMTDYDVKKELRKSVEQAAENYAEKEGSTIIRREVSKSVEERVKGLSDIIKTASYIKNF